MFWLFVAILIFGGVFISGIVEAANNNGTMAAILMIPSGFFIIVLIACMILNHKSEHSSEPNLEEQDDEFQKLDRFGKGSYYLCLKQLDKAMNHFNIGSETDNRCKEMVQAYYCCPIKGEEAIIAYLMEVGYNIMKRENML